MTAVGSSPSVERPGRSRPLVVITTVVAATHSEPDVARMRIGRYVEAVERHGGRAVVIDAASDAAARAEAFAAMDGLLISGGADVDPALYGRRDEGVSEVERERDRLELAAWGVATSRGLPIFGVCRGFQAINVFAGGSLIQHVDGHEGPGYGYGQPTMHPISLVEGTRLAGFLAPADGSRELAVNTYHHQAVRAADLAPGLVAAAWADSVAGPLVEALEAADGRPIFGVQCHPERTEYTPSEFERLWAHFIDACGGGAPDAGAPRHDEPGPR